MLIYTHTGTVEGQVSTTSVAQTFSTLTLIFCSPFYLSNKISRPQVLSFMFLPLNRQQSKLIIHSTTRFLSPVYSLGLEDFFIIIICSPPTTTTILFHHPAAVLNFQTAFAVTAYEYQNVLLSLCREHMLVLLYFDLLILGSNSEKTRGNRSLCFQKCFCKTVNLHPWAKDAIETWLMD